MEKKISSNSNLFFRSGKIGTGRNKLKSATINKIINITSSVTRAIKFT